jgi:hypothetical protein
VVYTRNVASRELTFAVSGMLWNRSLVMIDKQTRSLWSHLLGEAMQGELEGTQLEALPAEMVTWKAWRREHPETTVLNLPRTSRNYVREFYRRPQEFVFGWIHNGQPYHAGFDVLMKNPLVQTDHDAGLLLLTFDPESTAAHVFSRVVDGRPLDFVDAGEGRMKDMQTQSLWNRATGVAESGPLNEMRLEQRVGIVSFKRAWNGFHPESRPVGDEDE